VKLSGSLLLSIAAMMLLLAVGASARIAAASATFTIEGIWSFNGGAVAIQPQPGGTFVGTVVAPTKFAQCSHRVGEQMWTGISLQPDGSYRGLHQWYFETAACVPNPTLGLTAWRIMQTASGAHYLLVCFSPPGGPQPTIAASGASANVSYGCVRSAERAPLPVEAAPTSRAGVRSFTQSISLPSARKCFSRRVFQIHVQDPKYDPLKEVVVTIRGRRVAVVRRGKVLAATINLKGLPRGTFTVKIRLTTVLGHSLSGSRTYHTCAKKSSHSGKHKPRPRKAHGHS
jgi:hypothetical protein